MSDEFFTPSFPLLTFCPDCPPDPLADPRASAALCREHQPALSGTDDKRVADSGYFNLGEAGPNGIQGLIA